MGSDRILPVLVPGLSAQIEPGETIAARPKPPAELAGAEAIYADPAELTRALDLPPFAWSSTVSTMS